MRRSRDQLGVCHGVPRAAVYAACVLSTPALAQNTTAPSDIPTIYVREVMPAQLERTPGAAARLTADEIAELRPYTLHDAFDFLAGVRTIDDDALGRRAGIGVRGAPPRRSRKTLLLEDGTPINASTYLDPGAHYTPPTQRLETIDVLKGTGQVLYGPLNNHGIVNFRNKRATAAPETDVEITGGSQSTLGAHVMHRRTTGPVGLVVSYTGFDADGTFDIESTRFDDLYGSADWAIDDRQNLAASFTYFEERSHYDESNLTPPEYAVAPHTKLGRFGQEYNTFALNYRKADLMHDIQVNDRWSISTKLFATDTDRPRFTVVPDDSPVALLPEIEPSRPFVAGVTGRMESRDRHYRNYGVESRMQFAGIETREAEHTLQWGARVEQQDFDDMRSRADGGVVIDEGSRGEQIRVEHYEADAASVFFQDVIAAGRWVVTPGVRAERFSQSKVRQSISRDPGPHAPLEETRESLLLPGVTALYDGFRDAQLFASVQRGYSPAIARTASGFPLVPEVGINSQFGIRTQARDGIEIEAAVFHNRLEDTLVQQAFTLDGLNVTLNSGDSTATGVDLALRVDSRALLSSDNNYFAALAYNYTRAEFSDGPLDGRKVPEIPGSVGSVTFGIEHRRGWHLSLTASYVGSFYTDLVNTEVLTLVDEDLVPLVPGDDFSVREPIVVGEVPGRTLLSARFGYTLPGSRIAFWIQGRNLSDKLYLTDLENGMRPGAGRTVVAGVRFGLGPS